MLTCFTDPCYFFDGWRQLTVVGICNLVAKQVRIGILSLPALLDWKQWRLVLRDQSVRLSQVLVCSVIQHPGQDQQDREHLALDGYLVQDENDVIVEGLEVLLA